MIEIQKNPDPQDKRREYLLYIDGVLMENAYVHIYEDNYCDYTSRDQETSRKIAAHNPNEFPVRIGNISLKDYPGGIEHLDKRSGASISRTVSLSKKTGKPSDTLVVVLDFGSTALTGWKSPFSFADYAYEMCRILETRNDVELTLVDTNDRILNREMKYGEGDKPYSIDIDLDQIDRTQIYGLQTSFTYSSSDVTIADEVARISGIVNEVHKQVVGLLTPQIKKNTLEIRKTKNTTPAEHQLYLNGELVTTLRIDVPSHPQDDRPDTVFRFETYDEFKRIASCSFSELPKSVSTVTIGLLSETMPKLHYIQPSGRIRIRTPRFDRVSTNEHPSPPFRHDYSIYFLFLIDVANWKGAHSFGEYTEEITDVFSANPSIAVERSSTEDSGFWVVFRIDHPDSPMGSEIDKCLRIIRLSFHVVERRMEYLSKSNSITKPFHFPKEVAVACEQYLVYFVQFLRDLGVEATSELKHKAGEVLFTVTPANEEEALDKIRAALDIYLRLPASPVSNDMTNEVAIQRLESQVLRFQSDLKLAAAELQAKNATIEAQQLTINVQKALLNGEILLDSMKDVTPKEKEEDKVEFLDGSVALTVYKDKGVELNWAKMFTQLRALFKKKDK